MRQPTFSHPRRTWPDYTKHRVPADPDGTAAESGERSWAGVEKACCQLARVLRFNGVVRDMCERMSSEATARLDEVTLTLEVSNELEACG